MSEVAIKLNDLSDSDRKNLVGTSGSASASTKIQIVPAQPKTLSHLPSRPPVELAFRDLAYRVKEGRSNSKCLFLVNSYNFLRSIKKKVIFRFILKLYIFSKWLLKISIPKKTLLHFINSITLTCVFELKKLRKRSRKLRNFTVFTLKNFVFENRHC